MDAVRRQELEELARRLGHEFTDLSLLDTALHHSSYVHEHVKESLASNERLEFLGDAVLELVVTELLYDLFPAASEGQLSKARSGVVNEGRLAATARSLGLGRYLRLGRGEEKQGGRDKTSILADALEAVVAAVYLDGGLEAARGFLHRLLGREAARALRRAPRQDYKTRLQERVQEKLHITPRYQLLHSEGPDHDKTFTVALVIGEQEVSQGRGKSKKEAEQEAARVGLEKLAAGELLGDPA